MTTLSTMSVPFALFCDGGVVLKNPSVLGGTWAYCGIDENGAKVSKASGVVTPSELGKKTISNNFTELLAALNALESVSRSWAGTLYTDSLITLQRLTTGNSFKGISQTMKNRALSLREGRNYKVVLLSGHPSKAELRRGVGKRGTPVSVHNVWCDAECRKQAQKLLESLEGK